MLTLLNYKNKDKKDIKQMLKFFKSMILFAAFHAQLLCALFASSYHHFLSFL